MAELEYEALVPLDQQKVKYILEWAIGGDEDGHAEAVAYVVMKRAGGLLVALPVGFLPAEVLAEAQGSTVGLVVPLSVSVPPFGARRLGGLFGGVCISLAAAPSAEYQPSESSWSCTTIA